MPDNVIQQNSVSRDSVTDTTAVDTSHLFHAPLYTDSFPTLTAADSNVVHLDQVATMTLPASRPATGRGHSLIHDTGTMSLLLLAIFFLAISYSTGYKYIGSLWHNMFSVRRRESIFEDNTVKETQILTALIGLTCTLEAIFMYQAVSLWHPHLQTSLQQSTWLHCLLFFGLAVSFYLVQLVFLHLLGFIFSDKESTRVWVDGFKSSQSLLGLLLLPVACLSLSIPSLVNTMLIFAGILYLLVRFIFICKGFRIFYSNLLSLVYFILYLCAAELVPLALVYGSTLAICQYLLQS